MSSELLDWVRYGSPCLYSLEDQEFKASLDYIVRSRFRQTNSAWWQQQDRPPHQDSIWPHVPIRNKESSQAQA